MKKIKRYLFVGIVALSMLLSGCGTALYELTAEEEELIIQYAAYVVAKHNIQQKDGMSGIYVEEDDLLNSEDDTTIGSEDDTQKPDGDGATDDKTESENLITLAEIIGHKNNLTVTYTGSYVADNYVESGAYSVDAGEGKTFYVMKFTLTNTTEEAIEIDNASINPIFKLVFETISVKSEVTFLTTDFSTYQGTLTAGESVETILLFEVSESSADSIKDPTLSITIDKVTKNVKL